jgi:HEAT repeat protein
VGVEGEPATDEAATRDALLRSAAEAPPRAASFAIEQLVASAPSVAVAEAPRWLARPEPEVRVAAARAVGALCQQAGCSGLEPLVTAAIDDPEPAVAAAAAHALGALAGERCVETLEARLDDPRTAVVDAAMISLLRHGALEGTLVAGRVLERWIRSDESTERQRAAVVLGTQGVPGALRVVRRLLEDDDPAVRRAALRAAASSGTTLATELVRAMDDPASRAVAIEGLARMGAAVVPLLAERLRNRSTPRDVRRSVPRALALIAHPDAYEVLLSQIDEPDEAVRQKILASASRMRRGLDLRPLETNVAGRAIAAELDAVERRLRDYLALRRWLGMLLLDRWMVERLRKDMLRVLRLAELSPSGGKRVEPTRDAVFARDAQRRGRALEVLDDVLSASSAGRFSAVLERWTVLRDTPLGPPEGSKPESVDAWVATLFEDPEPFAKVVALDAAQFRRVSLAPSAVARGLAHEDPSVREFAALVEVTFQRDGWRERIGALSEDEDPTVRSYVAYALATGRTGMDPQDDMYTTLEKVLFLHGVELFSEVAPEDLMGLARAAEVTRHAQGAVLFRKGDPADALYLVIDGVVATRTPGGLQQAYREGEAFGELGVLDASARSDDATVSEDATVLKIAREDFVEVLRENGPLAEAVIRVLVRRLRALREGEAT